MSRKGKIYSNMFHAILLFLLFRKTEFILASSCRNDEFMCRDGNCTWMDNFCDHKVDCEDGSDEEFCDKQHDYWGIQMSAGMECLHRHDIYGDKFRGKMNDVSTDERKCFRPCKGRKGYGVQCPVYSNGTITVHHCHVPFCNTKASDDRVECNFEASFCGWKVSSNATIKQKISKDQSGIIHILAEGTSQTIMSSPFLDVADSFPLALKLNVKRTNNSFWKFGITGYYLEDRFLNWQNENCSECTMKSAFVGKITVIFWTHGAGRHEVELVISSISKDDQVGVPPWACKWNEINCDGLCKSLAIVNDGIRECSLYGTDEYNFPPCDSNEIRCNSGKCIPVSFPSSLKAQCLSNQTEFPFETSANECPSAYLCKQADVFEKPIYLRQDHICDGIPHCPHWDDEANCPIQDCPDGCISCSNHVFVCDPIALPDIPNQAYGVDFSGYNFSISEFCMKQWSSLTFLNISNCGLSDISCLSAFPLLKLVDASYNNIEYGFLRENGEARFIFNGNPIKRMTYSRTYELSLTNAGIQTLNWYFDVRNYLKTIYVNLPVVGRPYHRYFYCMIHKIDLGRNEIESPEFLTICRHYLDIVDLSNNLITNLTERSFQGIYNMKELNLAGNYLSVISSEIFSRSFKLQNLNLINNKITTIGNRAFQRNVKLRKLHLGHNRLTLIHRTCFIYLFRLEILSVENNEVEGIEEDSFRHLISLEVLDISRNNIKHLSNGLFRNMVALKNLNLKGNDIAAYEDMFYGLAILSELKADTFTLCCARPKSVNFENCVAPRIKMSSCKYFLRTKFLSPFIWVLIFVIIASNIVIFRRRYRDHKNQCTNMNGNFLLHMSIVDFIFGLCIFAIATKDVESRGFYWLGHNEWTKSIFCESIRFISLLCIAASNIFSLYTILMSSVRKQLALSRNSHFYWLILWIGSLVLTIVGFMLNKYMIYDSSAYHHICLMVPIQNRTLSDDTWNMTFTGFHALYIALVLLASSLMTVKQMRSGQSIRSNKVVSLTILTISIRNIFTCIRVRLLLLYYFLSTCFIAMAGVMVPEELELLSIVIYPVNSTVDCLLQLFGRPPSDYIYIIKEVMPRAVPSDGLSKKSERMMIITLPNSKSKDRSKSRKTKDVQVQFSDHSGWKYRSESVKVVRHVILCDAPPYQSDGANTELAVEILGLNCGRYGKSSVNYKQDTTQLTKLTIE